MDLSRRLIGQCATTIPNSESVEFNYTALLQRLLLFDTYILQSIRLKELSHLLNIFGYDGLKTILDSKALQIHCDAVTVGQVGQLDMPELRNKNKPLPLGSFRFAIVKRFDWQQFINDRLREVDSVPTLSPQQKRNLKNTIYESVVKPPDDFGNSTLDQTLMELSGNISLGKITTAKILSERLNKAVAPSDFELMLHPIGNTEFQTDTDIAQRFDLSPLDEHKIVERGLLAIGGLNHRIEEMYAYNALSGFLPGEVPIFGQKLAFLADALSPNVPVRKFQRVLEIVGFPALEVTSAKPFLDAEKLLEVRDTIECQEFRVWLSTLDSVSDSEIASRINSLRAKISSFLHTDAGENLRFWGTTGIGFIPVAGNIVGTGASLLDHFLIDKILPYSGPASFINVLYPSIFKKE